MSGTALNPFMMPRYVVSLGFASAFGRLFAGHFDGPPSIPFSPAAVAAAMALLLSASIFATDGKRRINGVWAIALLFLGLWQTSIALAYWGPGYVFVRMANAFGIAAVFTYDVLQEMIVAPWRSLPIQLLRRKWRLGLLCVFSLIFTDWFIPSTDRLSLVSGNLLAARQHWSRSTGPLHAVLLVTALIWILGLAARDIWILRKRLVADPMRREMIAHCLLGIAVGMTVVSILALRVLIPGTGGTRFAPLILAAGLLVFSGLIVHEKVVDFGALRTDWFDVALRGSASLAASLVCVYFLSLLSRTGRPIQVAGVVGLAGVLSSFPVVDRRFRRLVDSRFPPHHIRAAEAAVRHLIENAIEIDGLHRGFERILCSWSEGAQLVLVSSGPHAADWPPQAALAKLQPYCGPNGGITPEILEHGGPGALSALAAMIGNDIGAVVCSTDDHGNQLLAAFSARPCARPFTVRELGHAHRLLRDMQVGLSYLQANRRLRGVERLLGGASSALNSGGSEGSPRPPAA